MDSNAVTSPKNHSNYNAGSLNLAFNVTVAEDTENALISEVSHIGDWQNKATTSLPTMDIFLGNEARNWQIHGNSWNR